MSITFTTSERGQEPGTFLLVVHHDTAAIDRLVHTVVIDNHIPESVFPPDLDPEGVGRAIAGPQHKFIAIPVGVQKYPSVTTLFFGPLLLSAAARTLAFPVW